VCDASFRRKNASTNKKEKENETKHRTTKRKDIVREISIRRKKASTKNRTAEPVAGRHKVVNGEQQIAPHAPPRHVHLLAAPPPAAVAALFVRVCRSFGGGKHLTCSACSLQRSQPSEHGSEHALQVPPITAQKSTAPSAPAAAAAADGGGSAAAAASTTAPSAPAAAAAAASTTASSAPAAAAAAASTISGRCDIADPVRLRVDRKWSSPSSSSSSSAAAAARACCGWLQCDGACEAREEVARAPAVLGVKIEEDEDDLL